MKLKGLRYDIDRHGNERWYTINRRGFKVRMRELPNSEAFYLEYQKILSAEGDTMAKPKSMRRRTSLRKILSDQRAIEVAAYQTFRRAEARARKKSLAFTITRESALKMLRAQRFRCAVSGIRFVVNSEKPGTSTREPFRPSLDRIDTGAGYTRENVRWVCVAINIALADWGEDTFARLAEAYFRNKTSHSQQPTLGVELSTSNSG